MFLRVSFCDVRGQEAKEVIASRAGCVQKEQPGCLEVVDVWKLLQQGGVRSQGLVELVLHELRGAQRYAQDCETPLFRGEVGVADPCSGLEAGEV